MSDKKPLACIILAAGQGKRMKSALPKVLHKIAGRPLINWLISRVMPLAPQKIIVVTSPDRQDIADIVAPHEIAIQQDSLGTADAVKAALPALEGFDGDILILLGDMPLLSTKTLQALIGARHEDKKTGLAILGVHLDLPSAYGRLVLEEGGGSLSKIVEDKDCNTEERKIKMCNTGAFCVDGNKLAKWVAQIDNNNAQKEFYITDLVEIIASEGGCTRTFITHNIDEVRGANARSDLAELERIMQEKLRANAMENGATLIDPASVYFSWDTKTGRDVIIEPHVFFGSGVTVADHVHIKAFCHFEGAAIAPDVTIGPFARLRPGAVIGERCKIGNFVEIKNSVLGEAVKAGHLGYIGDADIGAGVNFSCGAICVNYDGVKKHRTTVGAKAMIGSNVNLIAPLEIGEGAYIAAGSTISKNVPPEALAVAREKPFIKEGWAAKKDGQQRRMGRGASKKI